MSRCEDEKMWRWEGVKMRRCEDEKVWRWEDVKMRRCEDEKMWRWEDVKMRRWDTGPHYWKNPALRRSRELSCGWETVWDFLMYYYQICRCTFVNLDQINDSNSYRNNSVFLALVRKNTRKQMRYAVVPWPTGPVALVLPSLNPQSLFWHGLFDGHPDLGFAALMCWMELAACI